MRIHLAILRSASWLVPGDQRADWLAEWHAELWHVQQNSERQTTSFCLGAFPDALWLRQNIPASAQPWLRLRSPMQCLGFLGVMAATCIVLGSRFHPPDSPLLPVGPPLLAMLLTALMALPGLLATTSLRLGEYPANRYGRRWVFLTGKIALILPIIFFAGLALWPIMKGAIGICMVGSYVIAFRWALTDQRQRCPQCLRLLGHPVPIGQPSHTLLESFATEFACRKGHGLLHVPDNPTASFPSQRWLHLDQSWSVWFS
jgi:hypothetical protein